MADPLEAAALAIAQDAGPDGCATVLHRLVQAPAAQCSDRTGSPG